MGGRTQYAEVGFRIALSLLKHGRITAGAITELPCAFPVFQGGGKRSVEFAVEPSVIEDFIHRFSGRNLDFFEFRIRIFLPGRPFFGRHVHGAPHEEGRMDRRIDATVPDFELAPAFESGDGIAQNQGPCAVFRVAGDLKTHPRFAGRYAERLHSGKSGRRGQCHKRSVADPDFGSERPARIQLVRRFHYGRRLFFIEQREKLGTPRFQQEFKFRVFSQIFSGPRQVDMFRLRDFKHSGFRLPAEGTVTVIFRPGGILVMQDGFFQNIVPDDSEKAGSVLAFERVQIGVRSVFSGDRDPAGRRRPDSGLAEKPGYERAESPGEIQIDDFPLSDLPHKNGRSVPGIGIGFRNFGTRKERDGGDGIRWSHDVARKSDGQNLAIQGNSRFHAVPGENLRRCLFHVARGARLPDESEKRGVSRYCPEILME